VFWRNGREGKQSEVPNDRLRALDKRAKRWGLVPTAALVALIVGLGLFPNAYIEAGVRAGFSVAQTGVYETSVFGGGDVQ
jgi:hypothetical protein